MSTLTPMAIRMRPPKSSGLMRRVTLLTAFFFGAFQAFMPYIGWLGTSLFARQLEAYDHWIAFSLLLFLGGKMIRESFLPEEWMVMPVSVSPAALTASWTWRPYMPLPP